jgi:hypothetical protein
MDAIRDWLYIGKYRETLDPDLLVCFDIKAMLLLAELVEHVGVKSLYLDVEDLQPLRPALLRQGVDFVRNHKSQGHSTLIACGAGINRSTTFAVAVLKEEENLGLLEAFLAVKRAHPEALPHPPLWDSLCQYYQESVSYLEVVKVT